MNGLWRGKDGGVKIEGSVVKGGEEGGRGERKQWYVLKILLSFEPLL